MTKYNNKLYPANRINIVSKQLKKDLIQAGCTCTKSLTLTFPSENIIPKHLQHHFIRGYFDGDGSVFISNEKH